MFESGAPIHRDYGITNQEQPKKNSSAFRDEIITQGVKYSLRHGGISPLAIKTWLEHTTTYSDPKIKELTRRIVLKSILPREKTKDQSV